MQSRAVAMFEILPSLRSHKLADHHIEFDWIEFDRIHARPFHQIQVGEFGGIVDSRIRTNTKDHNEKRSSNEMQ